MKTILLLLLSACWLPMQAQQTYHEMFSEGKTWKYALHEFKDSIIYNKEGVAVGSKTKEDITYVSYVISGDTVVNDKSYWKLYRDTEDSHPYYVGAWREEGMQIFQIPRMEADETLIYDFLLSKGDDVSFYVGSSYTNFHVTDVNTIKVGSTNHRRIMLSGDLYNMYYWVDGVGSPNGILQGLPFPLDKCLCDYEEFLSCYENGNCIFTMSDFSLPDITGITNVDNENSPNSTKTVYDLSGRRADGKKPGVYIKNGKKFEIK